MYPVWLFFGLIFGMGLLAQLFLLVTHGHGSPLMLINLAVVALVVFSYTSAKRSGTIITPDHKRSAAPSAGPGRSLGRTSKGSAPKAPQRPLRWP